MMRNLLLSKKVGFILIVLAGLLVGVGNVEAASRYSVATGNWSSTSTWSTSSGGASGASVPANGDNVYIEGGFTVTLTASPANSYIISINSGSTLALGTFGITASSLTMYCGVPSASVISGTGTLTLGGNVTISDAGTNTIGATISCAISLGAARTFTVADDGTTATDLTVSGVIGGAFGLTKDGAGTLVLSGANTYTGSTSISVGTLKLGAAGGATNTPLGTTGSGTTVSSGACLDLNGYTLGTAEALSLNGTGISSGGALTNTGGNASYSGAITLVSATEISTTSSGSLTLSGAIGGATVGLILDGAGTGTVSGVIGTISGTLTKNGTGTWTLSGANTYTGATIINGGTLKAGRITQAFGITSAITLANTTGVALDVTGFSNAIGSLTGGGANGGNVTLGAATLTIGSDNTSPAAYSGIISGTGAITKNGTGTLMLSGANTYTGLTTVSAGTLKNGTNNVIVGAVTVSDGGTYDLNGFSDTIGALTVSSGTTGGTVTTGAGTLTLGGTVTSSGAATNALISGNLALGANRIFSVTNAADGLSVSAVISGNFTLTKQGAGTLMLSGANTYTGTTTVSAGVLNIRNATALGSIASGTTVSSGAAMEIQGGITVGAEPLNITSTGISSNGALRNISGDNTWGGTITLAGNTTIQSDAGSLTLNASNAITATNRSLTLEGLGSGTISGTITTGSGTLTKNDAGTWTLSGVNTYSGATTVSAGVLNIQNAQGTGTTAGGVTVSSGAALQLQGGITVGAEILSLNGTGISNDGALRNISGDNTWRGTITLAGTTSIQSDAGNLTLNAANAITGTNWSLTLEGLGSGTISGTITTGTGTLTKNDAGTWTLSGANTYTGATTISAGTLKLGNATALGTIANGTSITSGAVLDLNSQNIGNEQLTINGSGLSNTGALINSTGASASLSGDISGTYSVGGSGNITLTGNVQGTLTKIGSNTLILGGSVDNVGLGVIANSGTVVCAKASSTSPNIHAIGGGGLTIGGGVVQLAGSGSDQIYDGCNVIFNSGTFSSGATIGFTDTFGSLTLSENSSIDLGSGNHTLTFSSAGSWTAGKILTVDNWNDTGGASGTEGKIVVTGGLSQFQLDAINFTGYAPGAEILSNEVVPKSKPSITSGLTASSTYGTAFSYQITATKLPISYGATGLPTGMSINTTNGIITVDATTAAGTYGILISATNGSGTDTKTLVYTVNRATLTITASAQNKTYGTAQTTPVAGSTAFTSIGLVGAETIGSVTLSYAAGGLSANSAVGSTSVITPGSATGGTFTASNYTITYNTGTLTVVAAAITVTATGPSKTYGTALTSGTSTTNFTVTGTLSSGEALTGVTLTPNAAGLSAATAAGSAYVVTSSLATGTGGFSAGNYTITYTPYNGTVSKKALIVTADNQSKCFGQTFIFAGTEITSSGLISPDAVTGVTLSSAGIDASASVGGSPYGIIPSAAVGNGIENYTIIYNNGIFTVNPLPTITLGTSPSVCKGTTTASLPYTATTSSPNQYSITFDAAAHTAGFLDIAFTSLPATPISLVVPSAPAAGTYTGTITVRNSATGCGSSGTTFTITINPIPTVSSSATGIICSGIAQNYDITSATIGTTYSWSRALVTGISNTALTNQTSDPITETLVNTTTSAINVIYLITPSANGCSGPTFTYTVTVNPVPTVNVGSVMAAICQGDTSAALGGSFGGAATTAVWSDGGAGGSFNYNEGLTPGATTYKSSTTSGTTVTLTLTTSGGLCGTTSGSKQITVNPKPLITSFY
jgi:fibronectin-binding autotransporter adhesin